MAEVIAHTHINTVVINTKHREIEYRSIIAVGKSYSDEVTHLPTGTEVLMQVAKITKGNYVGLT